VSAARVSETAPSPSFQAVSQLIGPTLPSRVWDKAEDGESTRAVAVVGQPLTVPPPSNSPTERPKGRPAPRILQAPDTTAIRTAPAEILSLAAGESRLPDTTAIVNAPAELIAESTEDAQAAEWRATFDEFIRVRKECGEATETMTFEKFSATLLKHRDALVKSTNCKKVTFAVAVKDGKASLKATPIV
jgi:hypothetical protein